MEDDLEFIQQCNLGKKGERVVLRCYFWSYRKIKPLLGDDADINSGWSEIGKKRSGF